ncbi:ZN816-like protein [Mya arenaria]|uniref:ZN816-like protein n=1 Tax=Mya arenaria TaxID=6604 RepID=A0ABY7F4Q1_MYAAR|nr:ZN816-like protein [Mya arenaria]
MSSQYTNPTALEPLSDLHVETKCDRITNVSHHGNNIQNTDSSGPAGPTFVTHDQLQPMMRSDENPMLDMKNFEVVYLQGKNYVILEQNGATAYYMCCFLLGDHLCSKKFMSKYAVERHALTHTGSRPYTCNWCGLKKISGDMFIPYQGNTGIGTVEVKAPVMCNICGSVQSSRDHLKRHMKIHTGEKPFKCEYCDIRFSRKDHLNSHFTSARCIERRQRCQTFL